MPNPLTAAPKDALQGHGQADSEKPSRVRRFNEAQRLARIMDEKTRTIGVDTDALAAQVNAKRQAVVLTTLLHSNSISTVSSHACDCAITPKIHPRGHRRSKMHNTTS